MRFAFSDLTTLRFEIFLDVFILLQSGESFFYISYVLYFRNASVELLNGTRLINRYSPT